MGAKPSFHGINCPQDKFGGGGTKNNNNKKNNKRRTVLALHQILAHIWSLFMHGCHLSQSLWLWTQWLAFTFAGSHYRWTQWLLHDSERFTMSVDWVVSHNEKFDDSSCANEWKWEWISAEVEVKVFEEVKKERISTWFQKVDVAGAAWCTVCNKDVSYASHGVVTLTDHLRTKKHLDKCTILCTLVTVCVCMCPVSSSLSLRQKWEWQQFSYFHKEWPRDSLRLNRFWSFGGKNSLGGGGMPLEPSSFQSFSFQAVPMPEKGKAV